MNNTLETLRSAVNKAGKDKGVKNLHAYPHISKIVVHAGVGKDKGNQSLIDSLTKDIFKITGQKPSLRKAKKSIAAFKLRAGEPIGIMTTLRGKKMADFLSKLINLSLPAIRDFRGLPNTSFDKQGNYSIGIKEHTVFPEISFNNDSTAHGLQITITTTSKDPELTREVLKNLGFPFAHDGQEKHA
jgi:large subunit ribosomal protein L5